MAYSTQRAVSDGNLQMLRLSIVYLDRKDIQVLLAGVLSTAWKWVDDTTIRFDAVVPNGVEVRIKRTTDVSQSRHIFSKGAAFIEETLDEDFTQVLYIAQEAIEGANLAEMFQDLDMHGYKLRNLGTATERNQAVSYGQFLDEAASPAVSAAAAKANADAAALSAQNAEVARVSSAASAATAVAAADSADISEANSKVSETAASVSATHAKASEVAAAASAAFAATVNPDAFVAKIQGNTGALQAPAGDTTERPPGTLGLFRYNKVLKSFEGYSENGWGSIGGGAVGGGNNKAFYQNEQVITEDYTIPANTNAMSAGPVMKIALGKTLKITPGSSWVICG